MALYNVYRSKKRTVICLVIILFILCFVLSQSDYLLGKRSCEIIPRKQIRENLYEEYHGSDFSHFANITCQYDNLNSSKKDWLQIHLDDLRFSGPTTPSLGGEYVPSCRPIFSTAIIVPYRNKFSELYTFITYINSFLSRQNIHYRIYVIEQFDAAPFNRAKLLNIGALKAMKRGFPCLIFHDVDLLPNVLSNIYACTKKPRHMSTKMRNTGYFFTYPKAPRGVFAIRSSQFRAINGMSNKYYGWDGEDDDLYARLQARDLKICAFEPDIGHYEHYVLYNPANKVRGNKERVPAEVGMATDGLNSLKYVEINTKMERYYTHIVVDLNIKNNES